MNKIREVFTGKKAFIPFITGGDPDIETTEKLLYALDEAGADIIEIGIPFSDPVAEGPVIERADERALRAGCTTEKLLELAERVKGNITAPLLFMSYYNPIFKYGVEKFTECAARAGMSGLIVPDLPYEERGELLAPCKKNGLTLISLIAPTSEERCAEIAKNSGGFLYCVSSLGVTGERGSLDDSARGMIERVRKVSSIPCAVGFGISSAEQAARVAAYADGVIIGSTLVRLAEEHGRDCVEPVASFAKEIKKAIK
jgi:tryptophan synthase alpha chain